MHIMRLRKYLYSSASRNAAASYIAFISTSLWGLVSIPIAVSYLNAEEIGLWAVVSAFLGYLAWMDLGVGPASGRLIADAVATGDQQEMNRWWSTTRAVLWSQGFLVILIGAVLLPFLPDLFPIPAALISNARLMLVGGAVITGLGLPLRGAVGLLIAQNRFHWVPLLQTVSPWINLSVFFLLLRSGYGLQAYIYALAASFAVEWLAFRTLVSFGPNRLHWDRAGLSRSRLTSLFSLSGNMALLGLVNSLLQSLPTMLLARFAGLGAVPGYNFSAKGPLLGAHLVSRTYQSFYPGLQRLHVTGQRAIFKARHRNIGMFVVSFAIMGASFVIALNHLIVQILAEADFFVGPRVNVWFAIALITTPLSGLFQILLPISGKMGKSALVSLAKSLVGIAGAAAGWTLFGIEGLAAVFAILPFIDGAYGYFRGSENCGYARHELSSKVVIFGGIGILSTWFAGLATSMIKPNGVVMHWCGRKLLLPGPFELIPAALLLFLGTMCGFVFFRRLIRH